MSTTSISWNDIAGTIYGGTLDVKNGILLVKIVSVTFDGSDDETIYTVVKSNTAPEDFIRFAIEIPSDSITLNEEKLTRRLWSNMYAESINYNTYEGAHGIHYRTNGTHQVVIADAKSVIGSTIGQFRTFLNTNNLQVVYALETPVTYQLTPTEVRSLLGLNNVWADCGAITELKYTRDLNLCINDIIARIEALEGGSNSRSLSVSPVLTKSIVSDSDTAEGILEGKTEEETEEETKEEAQNER